MKKIGRLATTIIDFVILYFIFLYSLVATLLFLTGEQAIHRLFSRQTHVEFNFASLLVVLPCYFILACWAAGSSISSGVVIPKM